MKKDTSMIGFAIGIIGVILVIGFITHPIITGTILAIVCIGMLVKAFCVVAKEHNDGVFPEDRYYSPGPDKF